MITISASYLHPTINLISIWCLSVQVVVITLELLAKKDPAGLDYFSGGFTFKMIPREAPAPGGTMKPSAKGVR
jgi:hypothetical protein